MGGRMRALLALVIGLLVAGCFAPDIRGPTPTTLPVPVPDDVDEPRDANLTPPRREGAPAIALQPLVDGLSNPLLVTHAGDGSRRLFIVEQTGGIRIMRNGSLLPQPFLDVSALTRAEGERGLLGLAFSPTHADDGRLYVSYTDTAGHSRLVRYVVRADAPDVVEPASAEVLLTVPQPYANHNGGHVAFGPDGMLYYGLGDGGAAGDPQENAQNPHARLGSLLRIDVQGTTAYAIPPDNPFANGTDGAPEVWAKGLRNPWRFSFDARTGDLYIGDVGQGGWEEINFVSASAQRATLLNFGWDPLEGTHAYEPQPPPFSPATPPVAEYPRSEGRCAVTGGHVYRGDALPHLYGTYLFGDYCAGTIWGLGYVDGEWRVAELAQTDARISSFGEDEAGELYVADLSGRVLRVADGGGALPDALRHV